MSLYRLYIDESGNSDLESSTNPNHRFLSLTGITLTTEEVETRVFPELEDLKKKFFQSHPDEPIVFHRKEMVQKKPPFQVLKDPEVRNQFDSELISLLTRWEYTIFSVLIDKQEHKQRYQIWRFDPYHYCLSVLLERYVMFLEDKQSRGDVMAESRGGKDDNRLKKSFNNLFSSGTDYIDAERFQRTISSSQLKVKNKSNNIAGLQLADILAYPSRRDILQEHELQDMNASSDFGTKIFDLLQKKYYAPFNEIDGYGRKLLP